VRSDRMSQRYGISSLAEARAYLDHPVLGPRLLACTRAVADLAGASAQDVLGAIDAVKLRSSMTLFAAARPQEPLFRTVLERHFGGQPDGATLRRI